MPNAVPKELASYSWHRVTILPLFHLPQDQLREDCNTRHPYDFLIITTVCWDTFVLLHKVTFPFLNLIACLLWLSMPITQNSTPLTPGLPLPSAGSLSGHGVLECGYANPTPQADVIAIQWSPTRPALRPVSKTTSIVWAEERAAHSQPPWRKPEDHQGSRTSSGQGGRH